MGDRNDRYNKKSLVLTILVQAILVTILFFMIAWKEPFPPIEEYGIELNFNYQTEGSPIKALWLHCPAILMVQIPHSGIDLQPDHPT